MKKFIFPVELFNRIVVAEVMSRGYNRREAEAVAAHLRWCAQVQEWSRTLHKFCHMDDVTGSKVGGWVPGAELERIYPLNGAESCRRGYYAHGQLGLMTAQIAVDEVCDLAEKHGIGVVEVIGAGHLMAAGHWTYQIAERGFIGRVYSTSGTVEAAPHGGKKRTIGPNPFAEAYPTQEALGFIQMIDTSGTAFSMGKVAATKLAGQKLPPGVAITEDGEPTTEPVQPLILTHGESPTTSHKLFGINLGIETAAAMAGSSLPTLRGHRGSGPEEEEYRSYFRFQAEKPLGAIAPRFAMGRTMNENVSAVFHDIMDPNPGAHPPGWGKARNMALSEKHGGILMTREQVEEHAQFAWKYVIEVPQLTEVDV